MTEYVVQVEKHPLEKYFKFKFVSKEIFDINQVVYEGFSISVHVKSKRR